MLCEGCREKDRGTRRKQGRDGRKKLHIHQVIWERGAERVVSPFPVEYPHYKMKKAESN